MGCPLRNPSLFTLKFDSATILIFKTIKSFSVKSEALRRGTTHFIYGVIYVRFKF